MKNELHRKGMFFGVVFIIILMISNATAVTNGPLNELDVADKDIGESQNIYFNEEKPDLKISKIQGVRDPFTDSLALVATITNIGDARFWTQPGDLVLLNCTIKKLFSNTVKEFLSQKQYLDIEPGKTDEGFVNPDENLFGIYRCYFEIDPDNRFEEENENNNKAWVYVLFFSTYFNPLVLGGLKYY